jgi:hypothetical protein
LGAPSRPTAVLNAASSVWQRTTPASRRRRFGYVDAVPAVLVAQMNHVIGTLVRVAA